MSRMRRLSKERVKATISGLALMIAIGAVGGIGSYAYFTDQAEAKNDLLVTMGTLSTSIDSGINGKIEPGQSISNSFKITNTGTLKQNSKMKINITQGNKNDVNNLDCSIKITTPDSKTLYEDIKNLSDIGSLDIGLGVINSKIEGNNYLNVEITISSKDKDFEGDQVLFDIVVDGEQINYEEGM